MNIGQTSFSLKLINCTSKKSYQGAIAAYDQTLEIEPDNHVAWYNRGNALRKLKQHQEALLSYDKALEIKPDYPAAWNNRGVVLGNSGKYEEAIASYDKALEKYT